MACMVGAGREWFWRVSQAGVADSDKPMTEPWKCPYHNGRMCFEVIKRFENGGIKDVSEKISRDYAAV